MIPIESQFAAARRHFSIEEAYDHLLSSAIQDGKPIPPRFTCGGENISHAQLIEQYLLSEEGLTILTFEFSYWSRTAPTWHSPCVAIGFGRMAWCEIRARFNEQRRELPRLQSRKYASDWKNQFILACARNSKNAVAVA